MDRQLTVWAAPGLVLIVALIALFAGHVPRGMMPEHVVRYVPRSKVAPAETPSASKSAPKTTGGSLADLELPHSAPSAEAPAKPASEPSAAGDSTEPAAGASKTAGGSKPTFDGPAGVVAGRIVYDGAPPAAKPAFSVSDKDLATCCAEEMDRGDRTLVVGAGGGIADVVVMIKAKGAEADGDGVRVEMDQKCCRYEPHVLVVPQGASLLYKNSDPTTHNVHTYSKKNKAVNSNVAAGSSMTTDLQKDEAFKVGCDIHPWMSAQIFVTEYATTAVTDADGNFRIEDVPPGEWQVELWGETLKGKAKVVVQPEAEAKVEWKLKQK